MTYVIAIPAALTFIAGIVMMLPTMRNRAAERGMSGDILVPGLIALIGAVLLLSSIYL